MVFSLFPLSSLTDTSDHIVVVDGVFRLLHTGFQLSEAIGHGETEELIHTACDCFAAGIEKLEAALASLEGKGE